MQYAYNRFEEISKLQHILILPCLKAIREHKKTYKGICTDLELLGLRMNEKTLQQLLRGKHTGFMQLWQFIVLYRYLNIDYSEPLFFASGLVCSVNDDKNYINERILKGDKRFKKIA